jgi:UPF0716 protein FxsA
VGIEHAKKAPPLAGPIPGRTGYGRAMSIFARLALLFVIVPLLELAILIQMGRMVGFWPTIALVVFTGLTGAWLARRVGLRAAWRLRHDFANGRVPRQAIMDGMAVLAGGALLLTPGILTDVIGFSLLFPATRHALQRSIMTRLERSIEEGAMQVRSRGEIWVRSPDPRSSSDPMSSSRPAGE